MQSSRVTGSLGTVLLTERIEADLMVPGRGDPVRDAVVVLDSERITYAGPASAAPPTSGATTTAAAVLPGLWDCHTHLFGTHEHGVPIALGTDIAVSGDGAPASWGRHGRELTHLIAAGLTPLQAIEAATANGPLTLGPQAPRSGLLAEGYDADVVGVWKSGRRVK